jgi:Spy/CpxP family protein refolding chaperone
VKAVKAERGCPANTTTGERVMFRKRVGGFAVILALGALALPLQAQQRGPGPGRGMGPDLDRQMAELTEVLDLTDEQAVEVRAVLEVQAEKRREMFAEGPRGDREAMRAAMTELQEQTELQLAEILSEEQMEKYRAHVAERMRRPPQRMRRPPL